MSLFALIVVLFLGIASIAALIYSWLIAGQRNETYGTMVVRRKNATSADGGVKRAVAKFKGLLASMTKPIAWRDGAGRKALISLSDNNTRPAAR
jgi:hypothetical protein